MDGLGRDVLFMGTPHVRGVKFCPFTHNALLRQNNQFFLCNFCPDGRRVVEPRHAPPEVGVADRMRPSPSPYDLPKCLKQPSLRSFWVKTPPPVM